MTKRVAMISEHASPLAVLGGVDAGGQNVYVGRLASHLARIGYEVDVFTRRDTPGTADVVPFDDGVRIVHVTAGPTEPVPKEALLPLMPAFTDEVIRFAQAQPVPYDIVHANFFMSGAVAAEIKRRLAIPFVVTFHALGKVRRQHQGADDRFPDERFALEERIVAEADHLIAECPQDEEDLIRLYDADPVRIDVIPAGVDPDEIGPVSRELAKAAIGLPAGERVVLHVGRMVPRKGVDDLIRGFALLPEGRRQHTRLLIAGGDSEEPELAGPEVARLRDLARREGIEDRVSFVGRVQRERLRYFYSAADVFVTTPWYEPFGITPLEAMACGTPVIGANVGGIKFSVRDGETGYLVPPRDPAAIADRLERLLGDRRLLSVFRGQSVRRVQAMFTWRHVAEQVAALYERVAPTARRDVFARAEDLARIESAFAHAAEAYSAASRLIPDSLIEATETIADAIVAGGTLLLCGNGGSAAEAQHFAAELVGRFRIGHRGGIPAIALTTDTSVLTAWANDASFEDVFARQVEAIGRPGDVLVGLTTSGASPNVLRAFASARDRGIATVGLLGGGGGAARSLVDVPVVVPAADPARVQEIHLTAVHVLSELVEARIVAHNRAQGSAAVRSGRGATSAIAGATTPAAASAVRSTRMKEGAA